MKVHEFHNVGRVLDSSLIQDSYTMLAAVNKLDNYRIIDSGDLVKSGIKRGKDIQDYVYDFVGEQGEVLSIANPINEFIFSSKLKALKEKKFITIGEKRNIPYGMGMLDNFMYGDWLVLVEGEKDRDSFSSYIYKNVVCTSTAGAGMVMKEILITLTNKFLIYYDGDDSGNKAWYRDRKFFEDHGCTVVRGEYPSGYSDPGELIDLQFQGDYFSFEYFRDSLRIKVNTILGMN